MVKTFGVGRARFSAQTQGVVLPLTYWSHMSYKSHSLLASKRRTPNAKRQTLNPLKPDLRSIDLGSALDKELFQGRRIKGTVLFRIHSQEDLSARPEEPLLQIIEKERPLLLGPQIGALMAVEANGESGDHIESLTEVWQRFICFNLPNHPLQPKQLEEFSVHRRIGNV